MKLEGDEGLEDVDDTSGGSMVDVETGDDSDADTETDTETETWMEPE